MAVSDFAMKYLTIKPSLACTADCPGCASRRSLHRSLRRGNLIALHEWGKILEDGKSLGAELLTISGGEPTLYRELPQLVRKAVSVGYKVVINTNGSRIGPDFAEILAQSGVHTLRISIYSRSASIHDSIRRCAGLHRKACDAVKLFKDLQREHRGIAVHTQAIIVRENIHTLDDLIQFHYELGSENVLLSYLEGDFERKMLVTAEDIRSFREKVIPNVLRFLSQLDESVRETALERMLSVYDLAKTSAEDYSQGFYQKERTCTRPHGFAMVLANGDVHPCDIVEYTHGPVMGNLFHQSLPAIWRSERWNSYRTTLHDQCRLCPRNLHTSIQLRPDPAQKPSALTRMKRMLARLLALATLA